MMIMLFGKHTREGVLTLAALCAIAPAAQAADTPATSPASAYGTIVGMVTNASKRPVAGATVTAVREGGGVRAAISGSDGVYTFADVPLGNWSLTAMVDGAPESLGAAV